MCYVACAVLQAGDPAALVQALSSLELQCRYELDTGTMSVVVEEPPVATFVIDK